MITWPIIVVWNRWTENRHLGHPSLRPAVEAELSSRNCQVGAARTRRPGRKPGGYLPPETTPGRKHLTLKSSKFILYRRKPVRKSHIASFNGLLTLTVPCKCIETSSARTVLDSPGRFRPIDPQAAPVERAGWKQSGDEAEGPLGGRGGLQDDQRRWIIPLACGRPGITCQCKIYRPYRTAPP
jgi:hypothetical protein